MLGITLSDGTFIIPTANPIELPNLADTFADVKTLVPTGQSSVGLTTLLGAPYNYWGDDDGDNTPTATGSLTITITDASGNVVTNTASLNACNSPYTLKLTSTLGSLRTQFGAPHSSTFNSSTATYYVRPKMGAPMTCFAKPNIIYQSESSGQVSFDPAHWERSKGFKMQDINNPAANFPRTGFNGAYFDLTVGGTSAESIIAANGSTVDAKSGASNIKLILTAQGLNIVRVRLLGPSSGAKAGEPGPAPVTMPTEFILYSDAAKVNKLYSFSLKLWFISRRGWLDYDKPVTGAVAYCENLAGGGGAYRVPNLVDYTNANGTLWTGGAPGQRNSYRRAINGGVFAEWGYTDDVYYSDSDWEDERYWAFEPYYDEEKGHHGQYYVYTFAGQVYYGVGQGGQGVRAACVNP